MLSIKTLMNDFQVGASARMAATSANATITEAVNTNVVDISVDGAIPLPYAVSPQAHDASITRSDGLQQHDRVDPDGPPNGQIRRKRRRGDEGEYGDRYHHGIER